MKLAIGIEFPQEVASVHASLNQVGKKCESHHENNNIMMKHEVPILFYHAAMVMFDSYREKEGGAFRFEIFYIAGEMMMMMFIPT